MAHRHTPKRELMHRESGVYGRLAPIRTGLSESLPDSSIAG